MPEEIRGLLVDIDEILKRYQHYHEKKEPVLFFLLLKLVWSVDPTRERCYTSQLLEKIDRLKRHVAGSGLRDGRH
jgi:hypothetical protein